MFTKDFWKQAVERVVRAFAVALSGQLAAVNFFDMHTNWTVILSASVAAAFGSLVLSLGGGAGIGGTKGNASLIK
jgi:hypothetical protein